MLYALVAGIAVGLVTGGRAGRLGRLRIRWPWLVAAGMFVQVALFSTPLGAVAGEAAPAIYLATNAAVVAAVLANLAVPGLVLVAAGAASNVTAIAVNGGYMPVSAGALEALGRAAQSGYSNSRHLPAPALEPLTDVFAMPAWLPLANVFSVGDVLISLGVLIAVVATMHGRAPLLPPVT
jgi:hypothetical protein